MSWIVNLLTTLWCTLFGCKDKEPTPAPTPDPTPVPTPTPVPLSLLRTQGTKFINAQGKQVRLMGAISCCEGAKQSGGWPWVSEAFMKKVKEHGGNHVTVRLGPNAGQEAPAKLFDGDATKYGFDGYKESHIPGQKPYYPLTYDPVFWSTLRKTLKTAQELGLYVEVSVIDGWVLRHRWPPWESNWSDIMGSAPKTHHKNWIQKVAQETGSFTNVIYLCGNENFLPDGRVTLEWEGTMADLIHEVERNLGYPRHLVGTNSHNSLIERSPKLDFVVLHGDTAVAPKWNKPLYMNEAGPRLTAAQFATEAKKARSMGSEFLLWRGDMLDAEFEKALDAMKQLQEGQ